MERHISYTWIGNFTVKMLILPKLYVKNKYYVFVFYFVKNLPKWL